MPALHKYIIILLTVCLWGFLKSHAQQLLIAVLQRTDSVAIYDIDKSRRVATLPVGDMPHEITYDAATQRCFITNFGVEDYDTRIGIPGRSITVIDPFQQRIITTIQTGFGDTGNMPHGIKVRPGKSRELFVNIERPDSMLVYDLDRYREKRRFPLPQGTHNFAFSEDGKRLWIMAGAAGVYRINPKNGKIKSHKLFQTPIRGLTFLKGHILASGLNELFLLSKKKLKVIRHYKNLGVGQILYSAVTPDERHILCPAVFDSTVLVVDAKSGTVRHRIPVGRTPINIQTNYRYAFVSHAQDDHITQIDLRTFQVQKKINANGANGLIIVQQPQFDVFKPTAKQSHYAMGN